MKCGQVSVCINYHVCSSNTSCKYLRCLCFHQELDDQQRDQTVLRQAAFWQTHTDQLVGHVVAVDTVVKLEESIADTEPESDGEGQVSQDTSAKHDCKDILPVTHDSFSLSSEDKDRMNPTNKYIM